MIPANVSYAIPKIQKEPEYMGKYPVIFLSLNGVEGLTFEEARDSLCELITSEVRRFKLLLNSDRLDDDEKIYIMN